MRFVRFKQGDRIAYGTLNEKNVIEEISSTPFLPHDPTGIEHDPADVRILAPCLPSKVVAIASNYRDHAREMGKPIPETPVFFFKPSTAVIGPGAVVHRPPGATQLDYEGELAVVIGSVARAVDRQRWKEVVSGFTCALDMTARDLQRQDSQWGRAKGFDTSAPLGPWIETEIDDNFDLAITTRVNGELRQEGETADMVFDVPAIIEFVTAYVTLLPGDVIMTGTPSGVGPVDEGDVVEVDIEDVGSLTVRIGL